MKKCLEYCEMLFGWVMRLILPCHKWCCACKLLWLLQQTHLETNCPNPARRSLSAAWRLEMDHYRCTYIYIYISQLHIYISTSLSLYIYIIHTCMYMCIHMKYVYNRISQLHVYIYIYIYVDRYTVIYISL